VKFRHILESTGFGVRSVERSLARESSGLKGLVVTALAMFVQILTLGRVNLHPLIMAIGVKR